MWLVHRVLGFVISWRPLLCWFAVLFVDILISYLHKRIQHNQRNWPSCSSDTVRRVYRPDSSSTLHHIHRMKRPPWLLDLFSFCDEETKWLEGGHNGLWGLMVVSQSLSQCECAMFLRNSLSNRIVAVSTKLASHKNTTSLKRQDIIKVKKEEHHTVP